MKKSKLRIKFYSLFATMFLIELYLRLNNIEELNLAVLVQAFLLVLVWFIKCENCGVYAVMFDKKHIGMPSIKMYAQPKECPGCGMCRV